LQREVGDGPFLPFFWRNKMGRITPREGNVSLRGRRSAPKPFKGEFKPHAFPDGFVLIIDTREQDLLFDKMPKGLTVKRDKLDDGDYSIVGFEGTFAIERKKISDFLGYITHEREKTITKMKRLAKMDFAALVIEVDEDELYFGSSYSQVGAEVIRAALVSFQVRYGVHIYMSNDRGKIERWILDWAIKYHNVKKEA
jgi:ERCC4-type nuclease